LYDSGYDAVAYQASNSIADKLSTGVNPKAALEETTIPNAVSLKADEVVKSVENPQLAESKQLSSLSGPSLATEDRNLIENPQEDPNLFQLSSPTEQAHKTTPPATDDGTTATDTDISSLKAADGGTPTVTDDGTTGGGGATAFTGGATTTDRVTDGDGDGDTALDTNTDSGGDTSTDGDSSDSSGSDSGDSGDSSDSSDSSGDSEESS
jgi:hypothetical protein